MTGDQVSVPSRLPGLILSYLSTWDLTKAINKQNFVISVNWGSDKSINKQNIADTGSESVIGLSEFEFVVGRVSTLICCEYSNLSDAGSMNTKTNDKL